jgi:hypothetical protein
LIWKSEVSRNALLVVSYPRIGHDERFISLGRLLRDVWFQVRAAVD